MIHTDWKRTVPLPATARLTWHETETYPREIPLEEFYVLLGIPSTRDLLPYLVAHMVMTQNGEAVVEGKATTIGTPVDGLSLIRVRSAVDAVVAGSGTLVHDDVTASLPDAEIARRMVEGRPPRLLVALVASTLAWDAKIFGKRFFSDGRFDKLVLTGTRPTDEEIRAVEGRGVEVARISSGPDGRPQTAAVLRALAGRGVGAAVCEGGPHFLPSLFAVRAIREYFLTTSPLLTGDPQAPRPVTGAVSAAGARVLLSRMSRYEHEFRDPETGARLVEAFERFRVVYPESSPPGSPSR